MKPRFRFLAALLALLAFSAFTAEGVWAAVCDGMADAEMQAPSESCEDAAASGTVVSTDDSRDFGGSQPGLPDCPLAFANSACAGAAPLPATASDSFLPSPEGTLSVVSPDDARGISPVSALFRPPRA